MKELRTFNIDELLRKRKVIITCGTGGVGKTTVSAALAIRAAMLGLRAAVITIDPARRLATSLGLTELQDRPKDLTPLLKQSMKNAVQSGVEVPASWQQALEGKSGSTAGSFSALMPNVKSNFDDFLKELSPSEEFSARVLRNPIFQIFAKEFSGTNEYMALERLQALQRRGEFDCIILDTPPSRNALAFLNAPKLMAELFEERLIRWLVLPANKIVSAGMRTALGVLEKLTGAGFMTALFEFASTLFEVRVKFVASFERTIALLESESVGFLMVTVPTPGAAPEVDHFIRTLDEHEFQFEGIVINRAVSALQLPPISGREPASLEVLRAVQQREKVAIQAFAENSVPVCAKLPELARDVHSVEDLFYVALALGPDFRG